LGNDKINASQLMKLLIFVMVGGTIFAESNLYVGSDIWLVYLIGTFAGCLMFGIYYRLSLLHGFSTFPQIFERCLGFWGSKVLCFLYIIFLTMRTKGVGDTMTEMASDLLMVGAPMRLIMFVLLVAVVYIVIKGLRSMATASEIMFIVFLLCLVPFFSNSFFTGAFSISNLLPVFVESQAAFWQKVLETTMFPYTDTFLLFLYFHNVQWKQREMIPHRVVLGIVISTLLLTGIAITNVAVLGKTVVSSIKYPFYNTMMLAGIRGVLERLDPLAVIIIIICQVFKGSLYYHAIVSLTHTLIPWISRHAINIAIAILFFTLGPGGLTHSPLSTFMNTYLIPIFQVGIPMAVWGISEFQRYTHRKKSNRSPDTPLEST